jgi:GT2 family glycosyltransferase
MVATRSLSVIIPNYNGEDLLRTNVPKVIIVLQAYADKHDTTVELVIVDDGSKDASKEILQKYEQKRRDGRVQFTIVYNPKNLGFAPTVNRGVMSASSDIVYLLNSDVLPEKGFLDAILPHFDDDQIFAVGSMDKSIEGGKVILRGRGIGSWRRGFLIHERGEVDQTNTLWVSGGSGAFRKSLFEKLGALTELMSPFYWEDIDLSYRALKAGYQIVFEPKSIVIHEHEKGAIKNAATASKVQTVAYRNQVYFIWLNISDTKLLFSHVLWLPIHLLQAIMRRDKAFLQGFAQALLHLADIRSRRERVQRYRKLTDKEVLKRFRS